MKLTKLFVSLCICLFVFSCSENNSPFSWKDYFSFSDNSSDSSKPLLQLTVYKNPTCGCCSKWIDHLEHNHFKVNTVALENDDLLTFKYHHGISQQFQSCHTGVSKDGYVFEGHIPAKVIRQFLKEKPKDAIGLSVPSMPVGSPGMEVDDKFMPYKVFLLTKSGEAKVYAQFNHYDEQFD